MALRTTDALRPLAVGRDSSPRFIRDVCAIARPWFWPVSLLPYYVGLVLATHELVPATDQLVCAPH
jgi:hypothetical protein